MFLMFLWERESERRCLCLLLPVASIVTCIVICIDIIMSATDDSATTLPGYRIPHRLCFFPPNSVLTTDEAPGLPDFEAADDFSDSDPDFEDTDEKELEVIGNAMSRRLRLTEQGQSVEVLRQHPSNPLHSVKSFEELNLPPDLLQGLYTSGYRSPSRIQETALPILLANPPQNMVAQSQSGTGKTAAFLLACLYRVDGNLNYPQVVILSPTYELALQTGAVAKKMARFRPDITFAFAVRGEELSKRPVQDHVVIGTPGTMMDWALRFRRFDPKKIRVFVLDEADIMIDSQGHKTQSLKIRKELPSNCQMIFFSATFSAPVMEFAEMLIKDPVVIKLKRDEETLQNIGQYYVVCADETVKYAALRILFGAISVSQAFIFVATKRSASLLAQRLKDDGHPVGLISGDLTVEERNAIIQKFRDGYQRVLIATNVMARGIDVDAVSVVINYDLPVDHETHEIDCETYLHRIGRTGRFGKPGLAVNLVDSSVSYSMIAKLEKHFGMRIKRLDATNEEMEKIAQD